MRLYRYAAERGHTESQKRLGFLYGEGGDVDNEIDLDFERSAEWHLKAARKGDRESQFEYGFACYRGLGRNQSFHEAYDWFSMAAEQGSIGSMFYLGELYRYGLGTERNLRTASKWYRRGAKNGSSYSAMQLARMYLEGAVFARDAEFAE